MGAGRGDDVTGGEALYTDMGHFGRFPIRLAWFGFVMPALVLNYFGQGALLLNEPAAIRNPFFHLGPQWALIPTFESSNQRGSGWVTREAQDGAKGPCWMVGASIG